MKALSDAILTRMADGGGRLDQGAVDAIADWLEDALDSGELAKALGEVASLAAHLHKSGHPKSADKLARLSAGFLQGLDE